jgi:excisionase family DNA binding protein
MLAMPLQPLAVDVREAGRLLSIAPRTIRAWLAVGKIHGVRLGRRVVIPFAELHRLIADAETTTPACEAGVIETTKEIPSAI